MKLRELRGEMMLSARARRLRKRSRITCHSSTAREPLAARRPLGAEGAAALEERSSFAPRRHFHPSGKSACADDAFGLTRASAGLRVAIPGLPLRRLCSLRSANIK